MSLYIKRKMYIFCRGDITPPFFFLKKNILNIAEWGPTFFSCIWTGPFVIFRGFLPKSLSDWTWPIKCI